MRDETIVGYVPALMKALAEVNRRAPFDPAEFEIQPPATEDGRVRYFEWGQAALRAIEAAIGSAERLLPRGAPRSFERILDFGCGRGRVLRALRTAFPEAELVACDQDPGGVDFCAEVLGATPLYFRATRPKIRDGPPST